MRLMAASRWQLMATIIGEALLLSLIGSLLALLFSRGILLAVHNYTVDNYQLSITIPHLHSSECWLIASSMFIATLAAIIPAIQVYRIQVTKTLHHA
ncbi:MAG TPA: hypothetical protein DCL43_06095 [Chitinophagaceae bacterium]|nr:hypothetical protein [Chitinophagaceae bacterium]HAN39801.1 hypothetical protein [Chitinophagaceae bacterium]